MGFSVARTKNGSLERVALPRDGDRVLGHRLEQRALRLGRGAVNLVGQDELTEDRPRCSWKSEPAARCAGP